ncbi:MAG: JAB domain-containing protein [Bryobacteraceae bacterium]|nr:JAB domain-containing protein [Bryobacteraceae bacterium]
MKNKTCVKTETDGQTAPGGEMSPATEAVRRSRVPLYRVVLERSGSIVKEGAASATEPREAARLFREFIGDAPEEHFCLMVLDSRKRVIGINEVSVGTLSASLVHPREVFRAAILLNGAAIIVAHNHPSGDPYPSQEDKEVTHRLRRAGELLGIPLADHIVLGEASVDGLRSFSFRQHGLL